MMEDGQPVVERRGSVAAAAWWTMGLSIVLAPLVILGPFIAGYVGGRKAKSAPAALTAALGPALIWVAVWWWLGKTGIPVRSDRFFPPADIFAPTAGLAILGGAFAGSGGKLAHVIGSAVLLLAVGWFWRGTKDLYDLGKKLTERPPVDQKPVAASNAAC